MPRSKLLATAVLFTGAALFGAQLIKGDATRGARWFRDMGCASCHSVRGAGGKIGPALGVKPGMHDSPNALAAAMWNHAVKMWEAMEKAGMKTPDMTPQQAADLTAYIAGKLRTDPPGDVNRGKKTYEAKLCASCHDQYSGARDFSSVASLASPYWMIAGLWQHGKGMLSRIAVKDQSWQQLTPQEVGDLLAYLQSRR